MKISPFLSLLALSAFPLITNPTMAQGWPADYDGVMLQAFSWDDYTNTRWSVLEKQSKELSQFFSLVWIPQSGNCGGTSMGYNPLYYFDQNSSFGREVALRSMIKTFRADGIGTIADVVINHRQTVSNWVDFPAETYNGVTYYTTYNNLKNAYDSLKPGGRIFAQTMTGVRLSNGQMKTDMNFRRTRILEKVGTASET